MIAHRGARGFAPENTLEAFEKAAAIGADAIELDVQMSRDRALVVVHDDDLTRASNALERFPGRSDYRVASFSLEEIRLLDVGSWFVRALEAGPAERPAFLRSLDEGEAARFISARDLAHYASGEVHAPTLEEALAVIERLGLRVNVELKASPPVTELVDRAGELLRRPSLGDRLLVSSFDPECLRRMKQVEPAIPLGLLADHAVADPLAGCRALGAAAYHPGCYGAYDAVGFNSAEYARTGRLPREPIGTLRAAGIAVNVWTENEPHRMRALIEAGASGIFTDYPNRMVQLFHG